MNWTHEQLRKQGYRQNPDGSFSRSDSVAPGLPHAKSQPAPRPALDGARQGKDKGQTRTLVRIVRKSVRLLDADNFAGGCKPLIDQLRYAKLIPDDDPESVEILFQQTKVATKAEEGVEVNIRQGDCKGGS